MQYSDITAAAERAARIVITSRQPKQGEIFVVGCSTSEILGERIGSHSSEDVAKAVMAGICPVVAEAGLMLAVQGCEHINRALCVSRACMERYELQEVWVRPWLHAGGAMSALAAETIPDHVMVENLNAKATLGMDIGGTLIGMHLKPVVVPVHTDLRRIGEATLVLARSRPKYVGGPRAQYDAMIDAHA